MTKAEVLDIVRTAVCGTMSMAQYNNIIQRIEEECDRRINNEKVEKTI